MASQLKIKTIYEENDYEERCVIGADQVMTFETLPKYLTIKQRTAFDTFLHGLHELMIKGTIKKLEIEEETI